MAANATYRLYVDGKLVGTKTGLASFGTTLPGRGTYAIVLQSIDTTNCTDSSKRYYNVSKSRPKFIDYTGSYSNSPEWINCIQQLSDPDSLVVITSTKDSLRSLRAVWGDGYTTTVSGTVPPNTSIRHTYVTTGVFTVWLILEDTAGCRDTVFGLVTNERVPTAGIIGPNSGYNVGCVPFKITFKNNSANISNGTIFTWGFGDGDSAILGSGTFNDPIDHVYDKVLCSGTVQLTAGNACGYSLTTWNPIQVSSRDEAFFGTDTSSCDRSSNYGFTNLSTDSFCIFPDPKQYFWDFGDGTNSGWIGSKATQFHNYKDEGPRVVCLYAKNKCGIDTTCYPLNVVYTPVIGFTVDTTHGCGTLTITVNDTSWGYGVKRLWDFGDGVTGTAKTMTHTYNKPGTYTLNLRVSNRCGTRNYSDTILVRQAPQADFSGDVDGCVSHTISLTNSSTTDFDSSATYIWDFGNGDTSNLRSPPNPTYTDSGTFVLRLTIADSCGLDTIKKQIRVDKYPSIIVQLDTFQCATDTVWFVNKSLDYSAFTVDFGDGSSPDSFTVNTTFFHIYGVEGVYQVVFAAVNNNLCTTSDTTVVRIKSNAIASFTVPNQMGCAPIVFDVTNTSQFSNSYRWYLDGVLFSTADGGVKINFPQDTTIKTLKLISVDTISCYPDSVSLILTTSLNPIASISKPLDSACAPYDVSYTNLSSNAGSYEWDLGNGQITSTTDPTTFYPGSKWQDTTYLVRLIAYNWMSCADTANGFRKIYPKPLADFGLSVYDGCGPLTPTFINNSTPYDTGSIGMMSFIWSLGDGKGDSTQSPGSHTYQASTTKDTVYPIRLVAFSEHGCRDTAFNDVRVYPKPTVDFNSDTSQGCSPLAIRFANTSSPHDTSRIEQMRFLWYLGDGKIDTSIHPSNTYPASKLRDSIFNIKLIGYSEHGCVDSTAGTIRVFPNPTAFYTTDTIDGCSPLPITFTNKSIPNDTGSIAIMSFIWDYGSNIISTGLDSSIVYNEAKFIDTTYEVKLLGISEHGCIDSFKRNITVHPTPTSSFGPSRFTGCGSLKVSFQNFGIINDSNFWNLGDGFNLSTRNTSGIFDPTRLKDTSYSIQLYTKTQYGCTSDTTTKVITIYAKPIADFMLAEDTICSGVNAEANNTSQGAFSYQWHRGDSTSTSDTNLLYSFKKDANAFVSLDRLIALEAITDKGCKDTISKYIHLYPYTTSKIESVKDSVCSPITVQFTNQSIHAPTIMWYFDDGDSTSDVNADHFYRNVSNIVRWRVIKLRTENSYGCTDLDSIRFRLLPEPVASFSPFRLSICDSGYYRLDNASVNNASNEWTFSNGGQSSLREPIHFFLRGRINDTTYSIELVVTNTFGCKDTSYDDVILNPMLEVGFDTTNLSEVCVEEEIDFVNFSTNAVYYLWYFGDTARSTERSPTYFYKQPGIYDVKMIAYDLNGCPDSVVAKKMIKILPKPEANFSFLPQFPKMPNSFVQFTNKSLPSTGLSFRWDFDEDGTGSVLKDPSHTYLDSGSYDVRLIADNGFCSDSIVKTVVIEPPYPSIDFISDATAGCSPFTVNFSAVGKDAYGYRWFFDDGEDSRDSAVAHTFLYEGYYNITLIAYGRGGQTDTTKPSYIRVYPNPVANFHVAPVERYLPNAFFPVTNESVDGIVYDWVIEHDENRSNVMYSSEEHPVFDVDEVGTYSLQLITSNVFGCKDTLKKNVYLTVHEAGKIYVPNAFTPTTTPELNDLFKPVLTSVDPADYLFAIYNRWGEKVFETNDISQGWDGNYLGFSAPLGVYVYRIKGSYYSSEDYHAEGVFLLLK